MKFQPGQRVRLSDEGRRRLYVNKTWQGRPQPTTGTVVRTWSDTLVVVQRDDRKLAETFHIDFWEPDPLS
jgi:hypothetical protein